MGSSFFIYEIKENVLPKWLKKKMLTPEELKNSTPKEFKKFFRDPIVWQFNISRVALGVAIGLFVGIMTLIPFQMIIAALLAVILRANLPTAVLATWICNPLTIVPITYFNYYIGNLMLGQDTAFVFEKFNWDYQHLWTSFYNWLTHFGVAFFIGFPFVATAFAILGYLLVIIFWRSKR